MGCPHRAHLGLISDAHKLTFPKSDFKMGAKWVYGLGLPTSNPLKLMSDAPKLPFPISDFKMGARWVYGLGLHTSSPPGTDVGRP